jgi:hypothetical protein
MEHQTPQTDSNDIENQDLTDEALPQEARFNQRGTFEGAYGEGSADAWQDEQAAQRTDRPTPERSSGMGGGSTDYDPDTGFAPVDPLGDNPEA